MMTAGWTADIVNAPSHDYDLQIDLYLDGEHRATILRADAGELVVRWYPNDRSCDVPVTWLLDVLERAIADLA